MSKAKKDYLNMTAEELARETAAFDRGAVPAGRSLTPEDRKRWEKARAGGSASVQTGPGRPKVGEGAVPVPVSIEAGLLRRAIAKAESLKLNRSEYFAKALQLLTDGEADVGGTRITQATDLKPRKKSAG